MPRAVQYKTGSIVYFSGDRSKNVFILKSGRIAMSSLDLHNGQEIIEYIKEGEFFGVKDAIGRYPREETATVVEESLVVHFTPEEFEEFINNKPDLIMKMLKIYSRQLRVIHGDVQNLLTTTNVRFPEEGMINAADYYYRNNKNIQALYFYKTYCEKFPGGAYTTLVEERLRELEKRSGSDIQRSVHSAGGGAQARTVNPPSSSGKNTGTALIAQGESFFSSGDYKSAFKAFTESLSDGNPDNRIRADFRIGCCLHHLGQFNESVQYMTSILKNNPKHPRMGEILFYLGLSYNSLLSKDKAKAFIEKAIGYLSPDNEYHSRASRMLKELGG